MSDKPLFDGAMLKSESMWSRVTSGLSSLREPGSATPGDVPADAPVHFGLVEQQNVLTGLANEVGFAFGELRRDPAGFAAAVFSPDVNDPDQRRTRRAAVGLTLAVPAMAAFVFFLGVFLWTLIGSHDLVEANNDKPEDKELMAIGDVKTDMPDIKKAEQRSGGGGGGGNKAPTPASKGKPPTPSLAPPILPATTKPTPRPPALPMMPTMQVDPKLLPPNLDPNSLGDPKGVLAAPSDGPGEGRGIGSGKGGGVGSGDGTGLGPGRGMNTGGGDPSIGGGDREDPSKSQVAATPAQILNRPQPSYTEAARQNKTQGNVAVSVLLGSNGRVKQVKVVKGLPDGLNDKAIEAAYKLSFVPAKNGAGVAIDKWMTINVRFTIR